CWRNELRNRSRQMGLSSLGRRLSTRMGSRFAKSFRISWYFENLEPPAPSYLFLVVVLELLDRKWGALQILPRLALRRAQDFKNLLGGVLGDRVIVNRIRNLVGVGRYLIRSPF